MDDRKTQPMPDAITPLTPAAQGKRLASIDALRGFDMFWIIGGKEAVLAFVALFITPIPPWLLNQFEHVEWEGFSAWDLIMPLFLFVSGASLPFSISKWRGARGRERWSLYIRLVRRIIILWLLGLAVQGDLLQYDLSKLRLYSNTLQAIASGYLVATVLLLTLRIRGQIVAVAALLLGFWAIMMLVPVPGHGVGLLEPQDNLAYHFDRFVLGRFSDNWTYTWTFSSLGFAATVMLGVFGGHILRADWTSQRRLAWLFSLALACMAGGWLWGLWFPIIKHIWTSSMVLWSGGWCFLLLGGFYWVIDVMDFRRWAFPFIVVGTNAIAVYVATHLLDFGAISRVLFGALEPRWGAFGSFLNAFGTLLVPWLILLYMYRKKTFIRV